MTDSVKGVEVLRYWGVKVLWTTTLTPQDLNTQRGARNTWAKPPFAGILSPMTREPLSTTAAPGAIGPYSQAIRASGNFLFCSGQIPLTPAGDLVTGDIREQTTQVMKNISAVLEAAGLSLANVVKSTIFLSSMSLFAEVNEVYGSYFTAEPPARSTVAAAGLPRGVDVEIEVIAVY